MSWHLEVHGTAQVQVEQSNRQTAAGSMVALSPTLLVPGSKQWLQRRRQDGCPMNPLCATSCRHPRPARSCRSHSCCRCPHPTLQRMLSTLSDLIAKERAGEVIERSLIRATTQVGGRGWDSWCCRSGGDGGDGAGGGGQCWCHFRQVSVLVVFVVPAAAALAASLLQVLLLPLLVRLCGGLRRWSSTRRWLCSCSSCYPMASFHRSL